MTKHIFIPLFLALLAYSSSAQNSAIGRWVEDESGLPRYQYTAALPYQSPAKGEVADSAQADPWFLLGNYRLTLFTHVSGIYQMMTGERAWELLRQMTLTNVTSHHPDFWIGQWSAPDAWNSSLSDEPGQPAPGATWSTAPVFCAHAHAWPLYCYFRLKEQVN